MNELTSKAVDGTKKGRNILMSYTIGKPTTTPARLAQQQLVLSSLFKILIFSKPPHYQPEI